MVNDIANELIVNAENQIRELQKEINFDTKDYPIEVLVDNFKENEFYIPTYQRQFIWDEKKKCRFVESVLLGLPIPFMFFSDNEDGRYEIIDGAQRTCTLEEFIGNELTLTNLEKLTELNGFKFENLPEFFQRRVKKKTLRIIVLSEGTSVETRQDIFNRINTGGEKALPSEIRRGTHDGAFMDFIQNCSENEIFKIICPVSKIMTKRYEDSELIVRFFAYLNKYKEFDHSVEDFLNEYVISVKDTFVESEMKADFISMLEFVKMYFPNGCKKSKGAKSTPRVRFEAISIGVALALKIKPDLVPVSMEWLESEEFKTHTTTHSSNSPSRVSGRIEYVRDKLMEGQ